MYIPELTYNLYAPIVLASILTGLVVASLLCRRAGASRQTVVYTALLTFVMIIAVSFMMSVIMSGSLLKFGFVGAGGALGLILGVIVSGFIHNDHVKETVAAWIIVAPLMYGLSKIACHIAGCCNGIPYHGVLSVTYESHGGASYFPVQLLETVVFVVIFAVGLVLFLKASSDKMLGVASLVLLLSCVAKVSIEFLRESHVGKTVTCYQVLVVAITVITLVVFQVMKKRGELVR